MSQFTVRNEQVATIIRDAGGEIIGNTKLHNIAYLLEAAGLDAGFGFKYRHFGTFSQTLHDALRMSCDFGDITKTEKKADWGGSYSTYTVDGKPDENVSAERLEIAQKLAKVDSVVLLLAASAVFLSREEGYEDPWAELKERKQVISNAKFEQSMDLITQLKKIHTPNSLFPWNIRDLDDFESDTQTVTM